jgi:hypothetical protein
LLEGADALGESDEQLEQLGVGQAVQVIGAEAVEEEGV